MSNNYYTSSNDASSRRSDGRVTRRQDGYPTQNYSQSHVAYDAYSSSPYTYSDDVYQTPRITHTPAQEQLSAYATHSHRSGRTSTSDVHRSNSRYPSNSNNHTFGAFRQTDHTLEPVLPFSTTAPGIVPTSRYQSDNDDPRKKYKCPECSKGFDRQSGLEAHFTVHTGLRLHVCPQLDCNKAFTIKSNMTRHFNKQHLRGESNSSRSTPSDYLHR